MSAAETLSWPRVGDDPAAAQAAHEAALAEAVEAARAEGLEAGRAEGKQAYDAQLSASAASFEQLLADVNGYRLHLEQVEITALATLLEHAFQVLLHNAVTQDPQTIARFIQTTIDGLPSASAPVLYAHPDMIERLGSAGLALTVKPDPLLGAFAFRLESEEARWEADLIREFDQMLRGALAAPLQAGADDVESSH